MRGFIEVYDFFDPVFLSESYSQPTQSVDQPAGDVIKTICGNAATMLHALVKKNQLRRLENYSENLINPIGGSRLDGPAGSCG